MAEGSRLKAPSLASVMARHLEEEVVAAGWPAGKVIGSEGDLLERFGVSRAVLREAVRLLEHSGVATMRRGPGGGLVVAKPNREAIVAAVGVWYSFERVAISETVELRWPLLAAAVALAAERAAPGDAEALVARAARLGSEGHLRLHEPHGVDSHIAALSGNPALALFIDALGDLGITRLRGGWAELRPPMAEWELLEAAAGYQRLAAAIAAGDVETGVATAQQINRMLTERLLDLERQALRPGISTERGKLAEQVAAALRDDIERAGWPVGSVMGSEADLIARHGVSRAILREAVRILEHHGAVRTKRGPRGGLVVTAPDLDAIRRSTLAYLQHEGVTAEGLSEMRAVVEVFMARTAAGRITAESSGRLREAVRAEAVAGNTALSSLGFHSELARAAGNRIARLFVEVLSDLVPLHVKESQRSEPAMAAMSAAAHRAHSRIVDAVIAGDADAAERRMRRHLRASVDVLQ